MGILNCTHHTMPSVGFSSLFFFGFFCGLSRKILSFISEKLQDATSAKLKRTAE
jgi:hypothetical protein